MIVQDDLGVKLQALTLAAKPEGVEENIEIGLPGEDGEPVDHRAGDEVGAAWFSNRIAASHGSRRGKGGEAKLHRKMAFPSWSLGTRGLNYRVSMANLSMGLRPPAGGQSYETDLTTSHVISVQAIQMYNDNNCMVHHQELSNPT